MSLDLFKNYIYTTNMDQQDTYAQNICILKLTPNAFRQKRQQYSVLLYDILNDYCITPDFLYDNIFSSLQAHYKLIGIDKYEGIIMFNDGEFEMFDNMYTGEYKSFEQFKREQEANIWYRGYTYYNSHHHDSKK